MLYPTFREACVALHLIEDDRKLGRCFAEARLFATGANLRRLFVTSLLQGQLNNPLALWERYCSNICDDLANRLLNILGDDFTSQILNQASYYTFKSSVTIQKSCICLVVIQLPWVATLRRFPLWSKGAAELILSVSLSDNHFFGQACAYSDSPTACV